MTALAASAAADSVSAPRSRFGGVWRIVRLLAVKPSVFFGVPWLILAGALVVSLAIALIIQGAGAPAAETIKGARYSWAVLSPQWYLVAVGVQAVGLTFSFALGFSSTRRDFWLGMSLMFVLVAAEMAAAIATLVQIEKATNGWFIGAGMFNALWYGQNGWLFDFFSSFALQLFVLFVGAAATTIFMRWRMKGMLTLTAVAIVGVLGTVAALTFSGSWPAVFSWFATIGLWGVFTLLLGLAVVFAVLGYIVIRRATPR
ncbi:hypothetical protein ET445_05280 [Agromyces protaetiae]|uniref:Uncharacterized protein n=1 Tax=Agromyces protaetiae TaxID=2509455 RepID=A0A4P6FAL7_9MICO|nr:hypothetical protein [Agromyces protaetiae]QAY72844.1 hypothetical protein ET445_05280 [Agromyces protaetiae]